MADDPTYVYDVFISYSPADREWTEEWLRPRLEAAGLQVCTDDDFEPGVPRLINTERAVGNSRQALLVLSPAWVASEWSEFAALLSQTFDPAARQRRLLPLMLEPCQVPPRIALLTSIDFTRPTTRDKEVQRVVKVVRGELRLRERPRNREQRDRSMTLQRVRSFWVKGVLENSLHDAVLIAVGMEYKPDAVQHWMLHSRQSKYRHRANNRCNYSLTARSCSTSSAASSPPPASYKCAKYRYWHGSQIPYESWSIGCASGPRLQRHHEQTRR